MTTRARVWAAGAALLALGTGVFLAGSGSAADDKDPRGTVEKIAGALEKNNEAEAKKLSSNLKETDVADIMNLFKLRKAKGFGVGDKPGAINPDGIEAKLNNLAARPISPGDLSKQSDAIAQAAYRAAAITASVHDK